MMGARSVCCVTEEAYSVFEIGGEGVVTKVADRPLFLMSAFGAHQPYDKTTLLLSGVSSPSRGLLLRV